jgi:hypothetical protein
MTALANRLRSVPRAEAAAFAVITAILVASVLWYPADDGGFVICVFRRTTGLPCPGCGLTRSFCAIAKGHVERGFAYHWLGPALFLVAGVYWVRGAALLAGFRGAVARFDETVVRWRLHYAVMAALLLTWVLRLAVDYL